MSREVPIMIGQGSTEAVDRAVAAVWLVTVAGVAVVLLGAVGVEAATNAEIPPPVLVGLLASASIVFAVQQAVLRSHLRFNAASFQLGLLGIAIGVVALVLSQQERVDFATAASYYLATLVVAAVLGMAIARPPMRSARPQLATVRRLARTGLPILMSGLVFTLFVTSDRWVASAFLGPEDAAPYALASMVAAAVLVVPGVVSQQSYPRMAVARGQGMSAEGLRAMAREQGKAALALVAPLAIALALFAWIGIPAIVPGYGDAAKPLIFLSAGLLVLVSFTGYGNFLNVLGAQSWYLAAQGVGVLTGVVLMIVGAQAARADGIALGMAGGYAVYGVVLRAAALRASRSNWRPLAI
jgi:O-antigen/teichoic acid export membrane protein